eukprot:3515464-Prymnesium_polylepis.1
MAIAPSHRRPGREPRTYPFGAAVLRSSALCSPPPQNRQPHAPSRASGPWDPGDRAYAQMAIALSHRRPRKAAHIQGGS